MKSNTLQSRSPVIGISIGADLEYRQMPGQREINVFRQLREDMVALKIKMNLKEISGKLENSGKSPKAKLTVFGEEIIEKEVKPGGNAGRVYLPLDWVGKCVKIIRID
ncbi:MAG: DUF2080 family transposase-associated protein [Desulfobacterales bacterium]